MHLQRPTLDRPWIRTAAFVVVLLWGLYQCAWNLLGANIQGDESIYVRSGWDYVHGDFADNREHPPFAKVLFGAAQLVTGHGVLGPRVVVAVLVVAVAVVVFLWLRRHVGFWAGLTGAGLWLLTPRGGVGARIDRMALLDPVMAIVALLALAAAWAWVRSDRWWLAPVSGALMALSVTSKVSSVVLLPTFLLLPVLHRQWRKLWVGGLAWLVAFVVVVVVVYAPMGLRSAITYMVEFQNGQNTHGHPITIDGHVYTFAPWWANLHFFAQGVGPVMVVVIVVGLLCAFTIRPDALVAYLGVALGLLVVFYVVVAKIALPHYYEAWMPLALVLTAIGYARLASLGAGSLGRRAERPGTGPWPQPGSEIATGTGTATETATGTETGTAPAATAPALRPRRTTRRRATPATWLALALVLVALVPSVGLSRAVATEHPTGIALVDGYLRREGVDGGRMLFNSATPTMFQPYFLGRATMDTRQGPFVAIVIGDDVRFPVDGRVAALLREHRQDLRRAEVGGLQVWTPRPAGRIQDVAGALTVVH